jgi:hypothetical protein
MTLAIDAPYRGMPDVGRIVERDGREDTVVLVRIDRGADPQDAELGVPVWLSDRKRYRPGDAWRLQP